jgi:L-asparaginase II
MSIICKVTRGNLLESSHVIYGVAIDEDSNTIAVSGNSDYVTCIRSAFKPFQAAASLKAGAVDAAGFTESELALMCASHSGEEVHVKTAKSMINKLDLDLSYYECGKHPPYDVKSRQKLLIDKKVLTPYHNNCSGKHAGMLALAKHLKVDPGGYTKPEHPVQQRIMQLAQIYTGHDEIPISIDGCSAVTPFFSLRTIALLFQKLVKQDVSELKRIYHAMVNHPYLIAGKNRFDTDFISILNGRGVTKIGGEAVRGIGIKTKKYGVVGMALKVLDGNQRCLPQATIAMLNKLELLTDSEQMELGKWSNEKRFNHRKIHIGNRKITWE